MQDKHEKPIHGLIPLINRTKSIILTVKRHTREFKKNSDLRLKSGAKLNAGS